MIRPGRNGDPPAQREAVDELYERARELEPGARAAFLDAEAGGIPWLRAEVLSLLEHDHAHAALGELLRHRRAAGPGADHDRVGPDGPVAGEGAAVLDVGELPGTPSTVVDLTGPEPRVLREGAVPAAEALAHFRE